MTNYATVTAEIARLKERADKLRQAEKAGVITQARKAIEVYGITAIDLGLAAGPKRNGVTRRGAAKGASTVGVPKYQDPKSGKTWTGRGKPPAWIAGAKNRDAFLVEPPQASRPTRSKPVAGAKGKPGSNVGVPKYRDPDTGKTWTGRGKPPLWIAGAANRADFLIKPAT